MAKTLLQLTQSILSDMDSDEVSSIYDTVEALQVAQIVVDTLEAEFGNLELPSFQRIVQLRSVSDVNRPNLLRYGDVKQIKWLRYRDYRNHGLYREVLYLTPSEFFGRQTLITENAGHVQLVNDGGVSYYIKNNGAPWFYTSVDNDYLIFDSFDSMFENTLEHTNTFAIGSPDLASGELRDDYVAPIPNNMFPLLLAESKSVAFQKLKQMPSPKDEQVARRQRSRMQNTLYKSRKADKPYARSKYDFSRKR